MVMETKNKKLALKGLLTDPVLWTGLFAAIYLAVLPMAGTIALRYLVLVLVLVFVGRMIWKQSGDFITVLRDQWPYPFLVWILYLLLFVFLISVDHKVALQNLENQWGHGVLAAMAGLGVAFALFGTNVSGTFFLGALSSVSNLVHLTLFTNKAILTGSFPIGFWGREAHHADLGYTACQAVILLSAYLIAGGRKYRLLAIVLILACLMSVTFASSRAGLAFSIFGMALVLLGGWMHSTAQVRKKYLLWLLPVFVVALAMLAVAMKMDTRWKSIDLYFAGAQGDAMKIACQGRDYLQNELQVTDQDVIGEILQGNASRLAVLRSGLALMVKTPWGWDGSRQSYQKVLNQYCPQPASIMAHTHNGWVDTALALGWLGALLYLWLLGFLCVKGYKAIRHGGPDLEWPYALFSLSIFWMIRGLFDSVFRDHMLEMQGFVLFYAFMVILLARRSAKYAPASA